jgi:hypothetical protein
MTENTNKVSFEGTFAEVARKVRSLGRDENAVDMVIGFDKSNENQDELERLLDKRVRVTIEAIEE